MQQLTSTQNPRVKEVVHLRQSRKRRQLGKFLIDGRRETDRAARCGFPLLEVFFAPDLASEETSAWMQRFYEEYRDRVAFFETSRSIFEKMAYGERDDGVLATARRVEVRLDEMLDALPQGRPHLIGVIEGVEKPGNVGAILRSADGAGVDALIVADPKTDLFNPNTIRASLGTIFSTPVCVASSEETLEELRHRGVKIYAAIVDGAELYTCADFTHSCAIVLGSEAWGLSDAFRVPSVQPIFLPMRGIADSLNVSTTAAILFYEASRQRMAETPPLV
ncbi:MAG: RNA methyltransferase [Planctomycetia bacterium]|nr:RNA methyltransferase [Planctomycetia bacterium]